MGKAIDLNIKGLKTFEDYLNAIYQTGKRTMREQAFTHFRGVIRNMYALTFPMGGIKRKGTFKVNQKGDRTGSVDWAGGKKAGQIVIARNVNKAFITPKEAKKELFGENLNRFFSVFQKYKDEPSQSTLSWYLQNRDAYNHPKPGRRPVTAANKNFVYKELLKRQGFVPSGWNKAASYFGIAPAAWIARWGTRNGSLTVQDTSNSYKLKAICSTKHPNAGELQKDVDKGMDIQKDNMRRILQDLIKKQAKQKKGFLT